MTQPTRRSHRPPAHPTHRPDDPLADDVPFGPVALAVILVVLLVIAGMQAVGVDNPVAVPRPTGTVLTGD